MAGTERFLQELEGNNQIKKCTEVHVSKACRTGGKAMVITPTNKKEQNTLLVACFSFILKVRI